jgi:hypothetical protein
MFKSIIEDSKAIEQTLLYIIDEAGINFDILNELKEI